MQKPFVSMLMMISIDGKIDGKCFENPQNKWLSDFYESHKLKISEAWGNGANTHARYFSDPAVDWSAFENASMDDSDNIVLSQLPYVVSFDTTGRVQWGNARLQYPKNVENQVIVVTTQKSSAAFRAYLKSKNIAYILAGESTINLKLALTKLQELFNINRFAITGGATINAAFVQEDLVDEIHLVITPDIEGNQNLTFCENPQSITRRFRLKDVQRLKDDGILLVYQKASFV